MRVTTKGRYAIRAMTNLAKTGSDQPVPIKKIAGEEQISPEFLEQIFFKLKKSGIINSVRGPGGGFTLNMPADQISARQIFEAVGEGLDITPCSNCAENIQDRKKKGTQTDFICSRIEICPVHRIWQEAAEHILSYFENLTLQTIIDNENTPYVPRVSAGSF
jgi:Rrf2 family transcriptional regulator, iron-sulfur cluster assembly transcription factor